MLAIKGIGPKKIAIIWHDLNIESIGELFYACNENRLIEAKGFGLKTQEEIRKAIEFRMASSGKSLYAQAEALVRGLEQEIQKLLPDGMIEVCGEYRRRMEIITQLVFVIGSGDMDEELILLQQSGLLNEIETDGFTVNGKLESGFPVRIVLTDTADFYKEVFVQTGSEDHVEAVLSRIREEDYQPEAEEDIYEAAGLPYIEPELREGTEIIQKAINDEIPELITYDDLKGTLHNHSTWSDGVNTLEEMVTHCRDILKLEYLGICDHSKSAVYAKGLSIERVLQQHEEINHINKKTPGFHIFRGIESDILNDGSLDYPEEILRRFDFVVASIHSNLKMNEEKATARLIKAIENPYTTILGHPTGRLLLSRNGYPIDHKKVIDACAANGVVIEINANPLRLDMDWRWHQYALNKGCWLSVNPDAHRNEGFLDMHYGILVARKGGLYKERCFNALNLNEIKQKFENHKAGFSNQIT